MRVFAPFAVDDVSQRSFVRPVQFVVVALPVAAPTSVSRRVLATVVVTVGAATVVLAVLFACPLETLIGLAWFAPSTYAAMPADALTLALRANVYDVVGSEAVATR